MITHGTTATTPTSQSGAHDWLVDPSESAPLKRNATIEPTPTTANAMGTHIHCDSRAECPPTWRTMPDNTNSGR